MLGFLNALKSRQITIFFTVLAMTMLLFVMSKHQIGLTPDSISYSSVAKNISQGHGVVYDSGEVLTHWPPLYPMMLSIVSDSFQVEVLTAGKILNIGLIGLLVLLFNLIISQLRFNNSWGVVLNLVLLFSPSLLYYKILLSEGLFMSLLLAQVYILIIFFKLKRLDLLIFLGCLSALMLLTRFAGAGFILGFGLLIILNTEGRFSRKLKHLFLYGLPIILLVSIWLMYVMSFPEGSPTNRSFAMHWSSLVNLKDALATVVYWLMPLSFWKSIVLFSLMVVTLIVLSYKNISRHTLNVKFTKIFTYLILAYMGFIITSNVFFDGGIPFDNRLLAPLFPLLLLLVALHLKSLEIKKYRNAFSLIVASLILVQAYGYARSSFKNYKNGYGYSHVKWTTSQVVKQLDSIREDVMYTNGNDVISALSSIDESKVQVLPITYNPQTTEINLSFEHQMQALVNNVSKGKAVLVYFENIDWRDYYPSSETIKQYFTLEMIQEFEDGFIISANRNKD